MACKKSAPIPEMYWLKLRLNCDSTAIRYHRPTVQPAVWTAAVAADDSFVRP